MPQVSRKKLPTKIQQKIDSSFYEAVSSIKGDKEVELFLKDLLTPTERVMIPKRLAIAILLSKGYSNGVICSQLNVTQSTVAAVARTLEFSSGFKKVIDKLRNNEAWRSMWQDIENLLYRFSSSGKVFMEEETVKRRLGHDKKTLA